MNRLSVIIPAHNEELLLGDTLAAVRAALARIDLASEVIVVDDASTDGTAAIARDCGVTVVPVECRQIAAARNAGARVAEGDCFVFVDADTIVPPETLRAAVEAMHRGAAGGGCRVEFEGWMPLYARLILRIAMPLYRWFGLAAGCFLFCSREGFESAGGFDERLFASEEAVMSRRLRRVGRFVVLPESVITSGRKLRSYTARELLGTLFRAAITGGRSVRTRDRLDVWYGPRRPDPGCARDIDT